MRLQCLRLASFIYVHLDPLWNDFLFLGVAIASKLWTARTRAWKGWRTLVASSEPPSQGYAGHRYILGKDQGKPCEACALAWHPNSVFVVVAQDLGHLHHCDGAGKPVPLHEVSCMFYRNCIQTVHVIYGQNLSLGGTIGHTMKNLKDTFCWCSSHPRHWLPRADIPGTVVIDEDTLRPATGRADGVQGGMKGLRKWNHYNNLDCISRFKF